MSKRGPKPAFDGHLETVLRHWPHLPEHVKRSLSELTSHYGPAPTEVRFPTPAGASWNEVEIVVLSQREAQIKVRDVVQCYGFAALGLASSRNSKRPRAEWRMLVTYAENPEPDAYYKLPKRDNLKVDISRFRRWLQAFFGIPGDPLKPFKPARWLPRFKIRADY
jgi:hypothetical protein